MVKELFWEYETEHFYFNIYKAWTAHGQAMFRAGTYIKKGNNRKYFIDYSLFAEWDYKNAEDAFEHAKEWLMQHIELLIGELKELKENAD